MAFQIPEEYQNKEYPVDQYVQEVINKGVARALERDESYPMPQWFVDDYVKKYGSTDFIEDAWKDCIATALDSYGIENPPTGNESFHSKRESLGFTLMPDGTKPQVGDIVQRMSGAKPYHAEMITSIDEEEKPSISYSNGSGVYSKDYKLRHGYDGLPIRIYRFTGRKEDLDAIENHNIEVERRRNAGIEPSKSDTTAIDTQRADTVQFLSKLADKYKR